MINYNPIIVFDFETGGVNPEKCELLQIAAVAIQPRTLKIIEDSEFSCYVKPNDWANVEDGALKVNNITKELVDDKGLELKTAWNSFTDYIKSYNNKKTRWTAPIAAGMNIRNFDIIIFDRLCKLFGSGDDLFFKRNSIDILDLCFYWHENLPIPAKYNMDALREFYGLSKDGAHNAITDVKQSAEIIIRFMQFHRKIATVDKFKGKFK